MVKQNFVGDKPVDSFPPEAIKKIPEEQLTKSELQRLSESKGADKVPGANKRAGVATRDPAGTSSLFDVKDITHLVSRQSLTRNTAEVKATICLLKVLYAASWLVD